MWRPRCCQRSRRRSPPSSFSLRDRPLPMMLVASDLSRCRLVTPARRTRRPRCCVRGQTKKMTTTKPKRRSHPCCGASCCGGKQSCGTPAEETRQTRGKDIGMTKRPRGDIWLGVQVSRTKVCANTAAEKVSNSKYPAAHHERRYF